MLTLVILLIPLSHSFNAEWGENWEKYGFKDL